MGAGPMQRARCRHVISVSNKREQHVYSHLFRQGTTEVPDGLQTQQGKKYDFVGLPAAHTAASRVMETNTNI